MLSFNQLSHACPLQEENIPLHSCNLQGLHQQRTAFAAFPLSLQNGKRAACFPVSQQGGIKDERSSWAVILRIRAVWACELTRLYLISIKMAGLCKTKRFAIFPLVKFLHPLYMQKNRPR